jgi:hypothetical protein
MAKNFTKRHTVNGYAAMGNHRKRPVHAAFARAEAEITKRKAQGGKKG